MNPIRNLILHAPSEEVALLLVLELESEETAKDLEPKSTSTHIIAEENIVIGFNILVVMIFEIGSIVLIEESHEVIELTMERSVNLDG